ncbi:MAG: ParA family protein [candidate division KSB1 bacterium]|nr:ParA family protein [candidate division KSB1 bacterium]
MGEVIAVASQKGGVGKTTTVVNLAASLAELGKRVLIVDVDPQGSIATSFGMGRYDIHAGILEVFTQDLPIRQAIHKTEIEGLDIVPSNVWSDEEEKRNLMGAAAESKLRQALQPVRNEYDFILIDCPPNLGNLTFNALIAADSVLVPVQCEYYALKALGRFIKVIRSVKAQHNPSLRYRGFLLTMVDLRSNLARRVMEKVRYTLQDLVLDTVIPRNVRLAEVPYYGKPALLFDRTAKGVAAYTRLAKELLYGSTGQFSEVAETSEAAEVESKVA